MYCLPTRNLDLRGVEESKEQPDRERVLLELHYLPCLEYFALLRQCSEVILQDGETFQKQSYRNRCYLRGPNKVQILSVPVSGNTRRSNIKEVTINYAEKWHLEHIQSLRSAYGKAPYFEYYFEYFEQILLKKNKFLWDLNRDILTLCLDLLNFDIKISESSDTPVDLKEVDNRYYGLINRKTSFLDRNIYQEVGYQQLFGNNFVPNISIIDLLFCEGPNAMSIIGQSTIRCF